MKTDTDIAYYLVIVVDALGQSAKLLELESVPRTPEEMARCIQVLKQTAGFVMNFRKCFNDLFDEYSAPSEIADNISVESKEEFLRLRHSEIKMQSFADTIVISVCLAEKSGAHIPMNGLFGALIAVCGAFVLSLARGVPIRGGMDIGVGIELDNNEIYGSALVRAHTIESQQCKEMRIMVGEEILDYLESLESLPQSRRENQAASKLAVICRGFFVRDSDDALILDYLGKSFRDHSGTAINKAILDRIYAFVLAEYSRFADSGDKKLAGRYQKLLSYLELRLPDWGITFGPD